MAFLGLFVRDLGIDLGTAYTRVLVRGKGVVLQERTVVSLDVASSQPLEAGDRAGLAVGRTPGNIRIVCPVRDGVVDDFASAQHLLQAFIQRAMPGRHTLRPRVVVSIPTASTSVDRRAVAEAAVSAGAREVYVIEEPLAAALGAGLEIEQPMGQMVVSIGGGTTEVAIISGGGLVVVRSLKFAGRKLDEAVANLIRRRHRLMIGESTAETLKIRAGLAGPDERVEVVGQDLITGRPVSRTVTLAEIREAYSGFVGAVTDAIRSAVEASTPEITADIGETGLVLTGGGALLRGLDQLIARETGLSVRLADEPMLCVARGTGVALESGRALKGGRVPVGKVPQAPRKRTVTA